MHYYQFNIGDYKSHTEHLSEMEDLAYRRLLDWYYLHESPIPLDITECSRQIRMRTHTDCIASVLREFFEKTEDGWIHHRANRELGKVAEKSSKASESAKKRWQKHANALPTQSECNATHNTRHITHNTEHITQDTEHNSVPKGTGAKAPSRPESVSEVIWADFLKVRKAHKAPVTITALEGIVREAEKAGWALEDAIRECVDRNWRSFKSDWVNKPSPSARGAPETFRERDARLAAERMAEFAPGVAARPGKRGFDLEIQDANAIEGYRQIV